MWISRVNKANKAYEDWEAKFRCSTLEEYYYGFQWDGKSDVVDRYVINFVFSTIEIKKPSLLFTEPLFKCKPKPVSAEFDYMASAHRAQLREDVINTIISDEDQEFSDEFELFVTDAFFRFGVMEVDYSANWIENPNAGKPILKSDNDPYTDPDDDKNVLREPDKLPEEERVYFKRIPPWRFRVGGMSGKSLKSCSWVGYWDYFRLEDLKANPDIENLDALHSGTARSDDYDGRIGPENLTTDTEKMDKGDLVKVWFIWDMRQKKKLVISEAQKAILIERKYKRLPLTTLKFIDKLRGWYPVPPVFNWKSPQDEINEARQQQRIHRRRASRKYLYRDGAFPDDEELDKLENGEDMTFSKTSVDPTTAVAVLPQAPTDATLSQSMLVSRDDLNIITGTSMEQRGQSDRTTATQAGLIEQRTQLRETRMRNQVAKVLKEIGLLVLYTIREKFSLDFWVKHRTNEFNEDFLAEFQEAQEEWRQFTAKDLGDDDDFAIDISLDSISPVANEESKQHFVEFLTLLTSFPFIAFDPVLVRETAYRCGYRNEKVIARMAQMAMLAAIGQMEQAKQQVAMAGMQQMGQQPNNLAQTRAEQMTPPTQEQVQTQLQGQGILQ